MDRFKRFVLIPLLLLTVSSLSWGRTVGGARGPVRLDDADPAALQAFIVQDAGNVRMTFHNRGELANPEFVSNYPGFEYPSGSGTRFLYSAGLWVGAVANGQRLVSTTTDGDNGTIEFWPVHITPLPSANGTALGDWWLSSNSWNGANGRSYVWGRRGTDDDGDWTLADDLDGDSLPSRNWDGDSLDANGDGNPLYDPEPNIDEDPVGDMSHDHLDNDRDGLTDIDDPDFDGDQNVGFLDDDNDGQSDEDGAALGKQEYQAVYQDSIEAAYVHHPDLGGHQPLDIEVVQHSYVLEDAVMRDVIYIDYAIRNTGTSTLDSVFFALFADPDIGASGENGDAASLDDYNYFNAAHQMMVQYDNPADADGWGPGVVGIQLVRAPAAWSDLRFTFRNFERIAGGDPLDNAEKYAMISSGTISPRTPQMGDWRELMGFGMNPGGFTLAPSATLAFTVAVIGATDTVAVATTAALTLSALAAADSGGWGNFPPRAFFRVSPPDSSALERGLVGFRWTRAIDPDGDSISYHLLTWTFLDGAWQAEQWMQGDTALTVDFTDIGDSTEHVGVRWQVWASDSSHSRQAENGEGYFVVGNFPPQAFSRVSPSDSSDHLLGPVTLSWTRASDPEGDSVRYVVMTRTLHGGHLAVESVTTEDTTYTITYSTSEPDGYTVHWRVWATDVLHDREAENGEGLYYVDRSDAAPSPESALPTSYSLSAYPNPFNPTTEIVFDLPQSGEVMLQVFDIMGRRVATLAHNHYRAGTQTVRFDGQDLASGLYFARLEAGTAHLTAKLLLVR